MRRWSRRAPSCSCRQAVITQGAGSSPWLRSGSRDGSGVAAGGGAARHLRTALFMLLRMYNGLVFLDVRAAHIASVVPHLESCLHSHSFRAAHGSWARDSDCSARPPPGEKSAQAHVHAASSLGPGLSSRALLLAGVVSTSAPTTPNHAWGPGLGQEGAGAGGGPLRVAKDSTGSAAVSRGSAGRAAT